MGCESERTPLFSGETAWESWPEPRRGGTRHAGILGARAVPLGRDAGSGCGGVHTLHGGNRMSREGDLSQ